MSDYSYKRKDELEKLRRAKMGDTVALDSLIFAYWYGYDDEIQRDQHAARECVSTVESLAKARNRLAMGFVASHYILYNRPEGPPEGYPLFDESLVNMCYSQLLKEAEAGNSASMLAVAWYKLLQSKTECFNYLLRSAELGCADSYYFLGLAYERTGLSQENEWANWDYGIENTGNWDFKAESIKWFTKGASTNSLYSDECQYNLGLSYYDSSDKVLREIASNSNHPYLKYMQMAASTGHIPAATSLKVYADLLPYIYESMGISTNTTVGNTKTSGCYIATAIYGSYDAPEVFVLRRFRDEFLSRTVFGRLFIKAYYRISPPVAEWLKGAKRINNGVKCILDCCVNNLEKTGGTEAMKKCPQCLGKGEEYCPVCKGTKKDPRNREKDCGYCGSRGIVKCNVCAGTGKIDDNDDYRRS